MPADGRRDLTRRLTLILLTWRIWWASNNASRWQMGFSSAFKGIIRAPIYLLLLPDLIKGMQNIFLCQKKGIRSENPQKPFVFCTFLGVFLIHGVPGGVKSRWLYPHHRSWLVLKKKKVWKGIDLFLFYHEYWRRRCTRHSEPPYTYCCPQTS